MPFFTDNIRAGASGVTGDYEIERSLRFDRNDSHYLARTAGNPTNENKFSFSCWVKVVMTGQGEMLMFGGGGGSQTNSNMEGLLYFNAENQISSAYKGGLGSCTVGWYMRGTRRLRDMSAWYHILGTWDGTQSGDSNRIKFYVNGVYDTLVTCGNTNAGFQYINKNGETQYIGRIDAGAGPYYASFYMAEAYFVDGTVCTPTDFIETNSTTGEIVPKNSSAVLGALTMGNNGFYLNFSDNSNTTASTLGKDYSGNGNNWTPYNFTVTSGFDSDSVVDTPTNNFCTLNPLDKHGNVSTVQGNLQTNSSSGGNHFPIFSTMSMKGGKYYMEYKCMNNDNGWNVQIMNIEHDGGSLATDSTVGNNASSVNKVGYGLLVGSGRIRHNTFLSSPGDYGSALAVNGAETGMCAVDLDNGKIWWGKEGTFFNSGDPANGTNAAFENIDTSIHWNFCFHVLNNNNCAINWGQQEFEFTPPTGFGRLCTADLPTELVDNPREYFNTVTYDGNNGTQSISGVGFSPDWTWIKSKGGSYSSNHYLVDNVRSSSYPFKRIYSNSTSSEGNTTDRFMSFDSDGFTVKMTGGGGGFTNGGSQSYVAWNWVETASAGFDIRVYSGSGSAKTVSHTLGAVPHAMFVKTRTAGDHWAFYHQRIDNNKIIYLNLSNSQASSSGYWNNTTPTSSVFSVGNDNKTNKSGDSYVAYIFSEIKGYSKFGKYVGNGSSSNGTFVYCGFRPALVIMKKYNSSDNWEMQDSARNPINPGGAALFPNSSNNQSTGRNIDFLANGFKHYNSNGNTNENGDNYAFFAWAEASLKYARAR